LRAQIAIPAPIFILSRFMRDTIKFDDQLCFATKKIGHIGAYRHLPAEFPAFELTPGQCAP